MPYPEWKFQGSLECHQHSHQSVCQVSDLISCLCTFTTAITISMFSPHYSVIFFYLFPSFPLFSSCFPVLFLKLERAVVTSVLSCLKEPFLYTYLPFEGKGRKRETLEEHGPYIRVTRVLEGCRESNSAEV